MPQLRSAVLLMLSGGLAATALGCSSIGSLASKTEKAPTQTATVSSPSPAPVRPTPAQPDPYPQAISRAASAVNISQSAQSQDDWRLVASRWQQAIGLIKAVPASSPHHAQARGKVAEYQRNLAFAQQQANRSTASRNPDGVVVLPMPAMPQPLENPSANVAAPPNDSRRVFEAPIIRRAGGTPVIGVTFNGSQQFQMIVDTGASGTVITPQMAYALQVVPVGQARVATASARNVSFPLGYVRSIDVGGAVAQNVLVAVSGSDLDIGLLGHDFFGNFDVTVRQDVVEFRER